MMTMVRNTHLKARVGVAEVDVCPEVLVCLGERSWSSLSPSLDDKETDQSSADAEETDGAEDADEDEGGVTAAGDCVDNLLQGHGVHRD